MAIEGVDPNAAVSGATSTGSAASTGSTAASTGATGATIPADNWAKERGGLLTDLKSEREKRQAHEAQVATFKQQLEDAQRRIQALAGVTPQGPQEAEEQAVRDRFKALFPHLADLSAEDVKALREMKSMGSTIQNAEKRHWDGLAKKAFTSVEKRVSEEIGGDLTPRQSRSLRATFVAAAESDPEFLKRYESGDDALTDEFVKEWLEDWFEPARRKVEKQTVESQRRVPFGKDRSIPGEQAKTIDVNDPKAVEDLLVSGFRTRGGQFKRQ